MSELQQWATRNGIGEAAFAELLDVLAEPCKQATPADHPPMSEAAVQQQITLSHSCAGGVLWRNNVGVATDETGRIIRYGLANLSKRMNERVKSSDLVGITPVEVTAAMVGCTVGVITAIECKHVGWKHGEDKAREEAQLRFINIVRSLGGIAGFATSADHVKALVTSYRPVRA